MYCILGCCTSSALVIALEWPCPCRRSRKEIKVFDAVFSTPKSIVLTDSKKKLPVSSLKIVNVVCGKRFCLWRFITHFITLNQFIFFHSKEILRSQYISGCLVEDDTVCNRHILKCLSIRFMEILSFLHDQCQVTPVRVNVIECMCVYLNNILPQLWCNDSSIFDSGPSHLTSAK